MNEISDYVHTVDPSKYRNPWHPDDPVKFSQVTRHWILDYPHAEVPDELNRLMWAGRLTQECPYCGHKEPAGPFCHNCRRMVHFKYWYQNKVSDAPPAPGKRRRGRPSKAEVEAASKVCECE